MRSSARMAQRAMATSAISTVIGLERAARTRRMGGYLLLEDRWGGPPGPRPTPPSASRGVQDADTVAREAGRGRPVPEGTPTRGSAPPFRPCPTELLSAVIIGRPRPRRVEYRRRRRPRRAIRARPRRGRGPRRFRPG